MKIALRANENVVSNSVGTGVLDGPQICTDSPSSSRHPVGETIGFPPDDLYRLPNERQRQQSNDFCNTVHMEHLNYVQCPKQFPLHEKQRDSKGE